MDLEKNLTGESHAKYGGTREVDGRKLAVIALEGKFSTHVDPKETDELKGSGEIEFSLEGELLWDPEARHFASYELSGPMQFTLKAHQEVEAHGQTLELDLKFALEGEMKAKGGL